MFVQASGVQQSGVRQAREGRGVEVLGGHRVIFLETFHSPQESYVMAAPSSIDAARFLHEQLASASPDLLRSLLTTFINTLMSAEADAVCGAPYGESSPGRTNVRNGYRQREFDTRAGTLEVAIPKLRAGSYFPDWLLERRRRAERAPRRWWRRVICWESALGGWRSWSSSWASPACRSPKSA